MNARDAEPSAEASAAQRRQPALAPAYARRIMVPVDGSPLAESAVEEAVALAARLNAHVRFVHVTDPRALLFGRAHAHAAHATAGALIKAQRAQGELILRRAVERAQSRGVGCDSALLFDPPARVSDLLVRAAAAWRADLVVMGTHARSAIDRLVMGSTAHAVVLGSSAPVLMIPGGKARCGSNPGDSAWSSEPQRAR